MMSEPHPALKAQFLIFCGMTGYQYFYINGAYRKVSGLATSPIIFELTVCLSVTASGTHRALATGHRSQQLHCSHC
jgi:hypothetical protein